MTGRCEIILNNGNFVYVKDGEISLTEHFAKQQYIYPRRIYEGLEFFIDMDTVDTQSSWVQTEFDIDFSKNLYQKSTPSSFSAACNCFAYVT